MLLLSHISGRLTDDILCGEDQCFMSTNSSELSYFCPNCGSLSVTLCIHSREDFTDEPEFELDAQGEVRGL